MIQRFPDRPADYDPADPWLSDKLGREEHVQPLEKLLLSVKDKSFVLAMDSPWGTGKSLLLRMWHDDLVARPHPCVLFNAWETDFADDPLIAFTEALADQLRQLAVEPATKGAITRVVNTLRKKAAPLALLGAKAVTSAFLGPLLNIDGLLTSLKAQGVDTNKLKGGELLDTLLAQEQPSDLLQGFREQKKQLAEFKKTLGKVVARLEEKGLPSPLLIFVDELDRCRPDYSLRLLERIKHLFGIPGIVFILAVDRRQLVASVNRLYGLNDGSEAYLRRFIDLDYRLPEPSREKFIDHLCLFFDVNSLIKVANPNTLKKLMIVLSNLYSLSLRDIAQVFTQAVAVVKSYAPSIDELLVVLTLQVVKKKYPEFYVILIKNKLNGLWFSNVSNVKTPEEFPYINSIEGELNPYFVAVGYKLGTMKEKSLQDYIREQRQEFHTAMERDEAANARQLEKNLRAAERIEQAPIDLDKIVAMAEFATGFSKDL